MSFFSMLQLARGREPPPQEQVKKPASATPSKDGPGHAASAPRSAQPRAASSAPPVRQSAARSAERLGTPKNAPSPVVKSVVSSAGNKTSASSRSSSAPANSAPNRGHASPAPALTGSQHTAKTSGPAPRALASARSPSPGTAAASQPATASPGGATRKKLSFRDVMSQAAKVNTSKLEVNLRTKDSRKQSPAEAAAARRPRLKPVEQARDTRDTRDGREGPHSSRSRSPPAATAVRPRSREPAPVAQPLPEVLKKRQRQLEARGAPSRRRPEDEDDLSDFVASEDEDDEAPHEEIWRLFNRGPKKRYVDYDSDDDMEARGDDILNEERRSALQARREDAEEERKLAELAQRKLQQRKRS